MQSQLNRNRRKQPEPKSKRMAIIYLLLLMIAIGGMFSLKRCSTHNSTQVTSASEDTETYITPIYE